METLKKILETRNLLVWFVCETGTITGIQNGKYLTLTRGVLCRSLFSAKFRLLSYSPEVKVLYSYVDIESEQFNSFLYQIFPQSHRFQFFNNENKCLTISDTHIEKFKKHCETIKNIEAEINNPNTSPMKKEILNYSCLLKKMDTILDIAITYHYDSQTHTEFHKFDASLFPFFCDFMTLVEQHNNKEHFLHFYANQLHVSIRTLTNNIQRISHKTPNQWINDILISKIKVDLLINQKSINQLIDEYNFSDSSSFFKYFKKHTGYSPKQFQQTIK